MIKIRLARFGKKKQPTYRLVASDRRYDLAGKYLESLGTYNPAVKPKQVNLKVERIKYWLKVGAQVSPTIHNLLVSQGVIIGAKVKAARVKPKTSKSTVEVVQPKATPAPAAPLSPTPEAASAVDKK